jgi:hypothetical protein
MKKAKYLLSVLLLAACSGGDGLMDGIVDSWRGASLDDAITQWGYPDAEQDIAGRKLYIWSRDVQMVMPTTASTTGTATNIGNQTLINTITSVSGGGVSNWNCTRILEVNTANIIVNGEWRGNNCPFMEAGPYSNWRRQTGG